MSVFVWRNTIVPGLGGRNFGRFLFPIFFPSGEQCCDALVCPRSESCSSLLAPLPCRAADRMRCLALPSCRPDAMSCQSICPAKLQTRCNVLPVYLPVLVPDQMPCLASLPAHSAARPKWKFWIKVAVSATKCTLTPAQPVLALALKHWAPCTVATEVPFL